MLVVANVVRLLLAILAFRGVRWAYVAFLALGLLYFPAKAGFELDPHPCELTFDLPLAIHSLTNYPHMVLFALGFVMASAQFRKSNWVPFAWAAAMTIGMGALVELAEGVTGQGHCRSRDLIPDTVGALAGAVIVMLLHRIGWRSRPTWSLGWWRR
ncbi:MAG TPA: hypothetical protein VFV34_28475 [Blastocatellia bacterium]|nr:hypothetical protein [Blastocatellia bacterium]